MTGNRNNTKRKDPLASWAITWIVGAWVYLWPFFLLQGSVRIFVGILWLAAALAMTWIIADVRRRGR